jgi:hypothetical protein
MTASNREIEKLFDKYNPGNIRTGARVMVKLLDQQYFARIVGLDLDLKNKKVYANLRLLEGSSPRNTPTRVDVNDCTIITTGTHPLYAGHHNNG